MKTKQQVINFLESKVGTKVKCIGCSQFDGQCVTLIKSLMDFLGVPDPYKARGHAKTCISTYLSEGIADKGTGFLSVFSNKNMGNNYGHVWCNAGEGEGTYYESNGQKALTVTKGTTYSYDNVCNFDKYILTTNDNMSDNYKGLDLTNKDSMKVAVDVWADVKDGKYVKKEEVDEKIKQATKKLIQDQKACELSKSELKTELEDITIELTKSQEEIEVLKKSKTGLKGEITKKQTEIDELKKQLETGTPILEGKRKLLAGIVSSILVFLSKFLSEKLGFELTVQELALVAAGGLSYVTAEGTKDIIEVLKGMRDKNQR